MTLNRRLHSSLAPSHVTFLAVWSTNHCPAGVQFTSSYNLYNLYSGLLYLRERSHKCHHRCLAILQIQDNGNDLEEEGGDDFVNRYAAQ
jgi:hypothetical protein